MGYTRGQPDWSGSAAKAFTGAGGSDLELASRLRWPMSSILLGELHFYEDFEAGVLHWDALASNGGVTAYLSRAVANSGQQSVVLDPGTSASGSSQISRVLSTPVHPKIGIGVFFAWHGTGQLITFYHEIEVSGVQYDYRLKYDVSSGDISVNDADLGYVVIGNKPWDTAGLSDFMFLQLVIDDATGRYVRVVAGGESIAADYPAPSSSASGTDHIGMYFGASRLTADSFQLYLDDVIVTRNEQ